MRFNRKIAFSLCVFYIVSVLGLALSMHFCGGKLASVDLFTNETACGICKNEPVNKADNKCCKNTQVDLKIKDSHQMTVAVKLPEVFSVDVALPFPIIANDVIFDQPALIHFFNKAPPEPPKLGLYVLNRVFRI
ncbi:HYC_CC_PP family protein [Pedobacter sp.]|uniref:HYC_CC_PP family protein n=1 Tax=Pedobacter sp. TaxID=1411316 RepID=UPI00396C9AFA